MTNLRQNELVHLARLCVQEQGGSEAGVKGEASLMMNLARKHGREVYEYVRNSGWFSRAKYWMDNGHATQEQVDWVADVLVNGNATQIDMFNKIVDLEHRIIALETADYAEWKSGYVTKKGEIVKIDFDGDGELDFAMYDGGRNETSLSVGKIDGWYKVTSTGVKTHTIQRNSDGTYTLTELEENG